MLRKYIGTREFYKTALLVAVPIMIQNGITNFVSMLDNIMVGRVGTEEMTGVAIVNQLIFVFNLCIFGAVSGAGIFGAQFFGKGNHDGLRYTFRYKLLVCVAICALGTGVFLGWGDTLIRLYLRGEGTPEEIAASFGFAKRYLRVMLVGFVPFALVQCYSGTLRETGETVLPMKAGIVAVGVNFVFNYLLIFGSFGAPTLGVEGAAIATVLSRFAEAAIVIVWTHKNAARNLFIRGAYRTLGIPKKLFFEISRKGLPLLINETLWAGGMAMLSQCYSIRGYDVISASNIASTVSNVFNVAFMAMGNAVGILVGQKLGAGKLEEAKEDDRKLIVFSVVICFGIGAAMAALSPLFPLAYNTSSHIRSLATQMMLIVACCMPLHAFSNAAYFTIRSGGKTLITFFFDSFYMCVFAVPFIYLLSRYTALPITWLYLCAQLTELGKCIVGFILIKRGSWIRNIASQEEQAA